MTINLTIDKLRPLTYIDKTIICDRCGSHIRLGRLLRMAIEKNNGHFVFYEKCDCGNHIELMLPFTYNRESHWNWDSDFYRECAEEEEGDDAI